MEEATGTSCSFPDASRMFLVFICAGMLYQEMTVASHKLLFLLSYLQITGHFNLFSLYILGVASNL
jgi:hypothetical protein